MPRSPIDTFRVKRGNGELLAVVKHAHDSLVWMWQRPGHTIVETFIGEQDDAVEFITDTLNRGQPDARRY